MIIGITATALTFVALLLSVVAYYLYDRQKEKPLLKFARLSFYIAGALIVFQAVLLLYGILTHHFEWSYVYNYSSRDLNLFYLISAFWAGQEGTFLLWLLFGVVYGLWIIRLRKTEEALVMSFFNLVLAFVVIILIKKNPFTYIWQTNPSAFQMGMTPPDGAGLNPLLQDPWMVIHPPILFAGYSATMIPFAFAMSALVKRNYDNWIKSVFPFAVLVGLVLGTGIILGGYWAYTTLGWGGYWAWDPVENSSLIPWLFSLALIHGLLIQRKQGGMKKTNILLALITFILVLYGNFLTRSGILTDFSVHSFGKSEISGYLIAFVGLFMALSLLMFIFRINEVKYQPVYTDLATRESFMNFGMMVLILTALFVFVGTSLPLFSSILKDNPESFIPRYYNYIAGPAAVLLALLMGLSPVLRWKTNSWDRLRTVVLHGAIGLAFGIVLFILGIRNIISLLIMVFSVFLILVNGQIAIRFWRNKNYAFGGYLAHVGVGLMLMGIVTSSVYDSSVETTLPKDSPKEVFGYQIVYKGKAPSSDGKDKVILLVDGKETKAKFYWSDYSQAWMVGPSVENKWIRDLYISPIQIIPPEQILPPGDELILIKGQKVKFGDYVLLFKAYDMNTHQMGGEEIILKAVVEVYDGKGNLLSEIKPGIHIKGKNKKRLAVKFVDNRRTVYLKSINVEKRSVSVSISKSAPQADAVTGKEILTAQITVKPFINLLWLGTFIMIIGFLFSLYHRFKEQ
ncbi:MAG: cytochrome c biogenesis protein CcsA [Calditrichaeota bacterium]|nr:cytochrome c biogenesis protein CcsA [Calditrichota bacterium]